VCDQISDAILDEFLKQDENSKVAVECFITNNMLVIGGEAHSSADVDIIGTAKSVISAIGYDGTNGFDPESAVFINTLHEQSGDIRRGVEREDEKNMGAGDQGIMFGYASSETSDMMPAGIVLSNTTMEIYDMLRKGGELPGCRPDAKCQYTVEYDGNTDMPVRVNTVLISMQHDPDVTEIVLKRYFLEKIFPLVKKRHPEISHLFDCSFELMVNPTGRFVIGGPEGDTGLTGRKIIVDTYGGRCPHGGGAFSGKDCTKVDRSAAYGARYIAKLLVMSGLAKTHATVQLSYAIGVSRPISIYVDGDLEAPYNDVINAIRNTCPLTPYEMVTRFSLTKPVFSQTSVYGHFGNEKYAWERISADDIYKIRKCVGFE
jgi:S-adenosylmethionine synthetase